MLTPTERQALEDVLREVRTGSKEELQRLLDWFRGCSDAIDGLDLATRAAQSFPRKLRAPLLELLTELERRFLPSYHSGGPEELFDQPRFPCTKLVVLRRWMEEKDPTGLAVTRRHLASEPHPIVRVAMCDLLHEMGDSTDEALLGLLQDPDPRVVASALEAISALSINLPVETLLELDSLKDVTVQESAARFFAHQILTGLMAQLPQLAASGKSSRRIAVSHILGQMVTEPTAVTCLLGMIEKEEDLAVMDACLESLLRQVSQENLPALLGPVCTSLLKMPGGSGKIDGFLESVTMRIGGDEEKVKSILRDQRPAALAHWSRVKPVSRPSLGTSIRSGVHRLSRKLLAYSGRHRHVGDPISPVIRPALQALKISLPPLLVGLVWAWLLASPGPAPPPAFAPGTAAGARPSRDPGPGGRSFQDRFLTSRAVSPRVTDAEVTFAPGQDIQRSGTVLALSDRCAVVRAGGETVRCHGTRPDGLRIGGSFSFRGKIRGRSADRAWDLDLE